MFSSEAMIQYLMNEAIRLGVPSEQALSTVISQFNVQQPAGVQLQPQPLPQHSVDLNYPLVLIPVTDSTEVQRLQRGQTLAQESPTNQTKIEVLDEPNTPVDVMRNFEAKYENLNSVATMSRPSTSSLPDVDSNFGPIKERCAVCGDAATGFHYDTASCNGCKTFFRRTVVSGRKFEYGRCACRACRFQKCVDAGMNPNAIQYQPSANLTLSIARKVFTKPKKTVMKSISVEKPIVTPQDDILKRIGHVLHIEERYSRLRQSTFFPYDEEMSLRDLIRKKHTSFGEAERYPLVEKWPKRPQTSNVKDLIKLGFKFWYYLDLYLSVEYLKTFDVFTELSENDQLNLSKTIAIPNYLLTNGYFTYLQRSNMTCFPDGHVMFSWKSDNEMVSIEKTVRDGVVENVAKLKMDQIQYSLLRAIISLHDGIHKLTPEGRALITNERSKYTTALLKYLQNKFGVDLGTRRFGESMALVSTIFYKARKFYDYHAYRRYVLKDPAPTNLMADFLLDEEKNEAGESRIEVLS